MGEFETIESSGASWRAYLAGDRQGAAPGVVLYHAWWGLVPDVTAYADRLADEGFSVLAPDLFDGATASTVEEAERLAGSADDDAVEALALAAVDRLADRVGASARLGAVGFSFGAPWAVWTPAERDRLGASVVYYGTLTGASLGRASVPVLGHFAESDPYEPDEGVTAFETELRSAGREVEIHRYPGTGHWFAEPSREAYQPAAAQLAFQRTVAFLRRQLRAGT